MAPMSEMEAKDRRQLEERRKETRFGVSIDIEWVAGGEVRRGRLTDVSSNGCFVLTGGEFSDGEVVRIYLPLTDGTRIEFLGEIRNHVLDIGFAVRFVSLTDAQKQFIKNFAELHNGG